MPVLRLRRVGNSLGLILPKDLLASKGLHEDDPVRVELERATRLDDVVGRLRRYRRSAPEWNEATREGDDR